jgi:hypothetical protein
MNFITALIALAIVLIGGYYIINVVTPSERDAVIQEYTPDQRTIDGAQKMLEDGAKEAQKLLPL